MSNTPEKQERVKFNSLSSGSSTLSANTPEVSVNQEKTEDFIKANDNINFWQGVALSAGLIGTSAATQMLSLGLALSDPMDAIPDPFSFSLNGIRRFMLNLDLPTLPGMTGTSHGYISSILSKEGMDRHLMMNQLWKNDAISQKLDFTPDDDDLIPLAAGQTTFGEARAAWRDMADGKSNWFLTDWMKGSVDYMTDVSQNFNEQFKTGSDNADYIIPQISNLLGSVAASYLTGKATGAAMAKGGNIKMPHRVKGVNTDFLTKVNDLNRFESYRKASQAGVTFAQVSGEAVLQAHQTANDVADEKFAEFGGKSYQGELERYLEGVYNEIKKSNPDVNITGLNKIRIEREAKDAFQKQWSEENPEIAKRVQEAYTTAYKSVLDMSVINIALNWTSSGLYIKPYHASRSILKSPKGEIFKNIRNESLQEYAEEGTTAVADLYGRAKADNEEYTGGRFIKDFFSKEVQEQALWGALGGAMQTAMVTATDYKELKKQYDVQQEILGTYDDIVGIKGSEELRKQLYFMADVNELQDIMLKADALEKAGNKEEAEKLVSGILHNQAYTAMKNGTTSALINTYEQLSQNEEFTEQERAKASEAITTIKALEKVYNEAQKYHNPIDVYNVDAQLLEANKLRSSVVNTKLKELHEKAMEEFYALAPNVMPEGYEDKWFDSANKERGNSPMTDAFLELQENVASLNGAISELNQQRRNLTSEQQQYQEYMLKQFYAKYATYQMIEDKETKKSGKLSKVKSEKFLKTLENLYNKTAQDSKINPETLGKMKKLLNRDVFIAALQKKQEEVKASQKIAQEAREEVPAPVVTPEITPEITPEKQIITESLNGKLLKTTRSGDIVETQEDLSQTDDNDFGGEALFMSPADVNDNISDEEMNSIAEDVAAYTSEMRKDGTIPSFKEFILDYAESGNKADAERYFNVFKEAWERNHKRNPKFEKADYTKVYNEVFSSKSDILKRLTDKAEKAVVETTSEQTTESNAKEGSPKIVTETTDEGEPIYIHSGSILAFPGSAAAYSAYGVNRFIQETEDGIEITYERRDGKLYPSTHTNARPLAHPDKFREGTNLIAEVHPNSTQIPVPLHFTEEHLDGKYVGATMVLADGQEVVTFGDLLKGDIKVMVKFPANENDIEKFPDFEVTLKRIEEGSDEYWDKVPMVFYQEGKTAQEGSGFIHTPDYYSAITATKESLPDAIAETKSIRKLVRNNGKALLQVASKTNGTISKSELPKGQYVTLQEADPQSMLSIRTGEGTGGVQYMKDGKLVSLTDQPLNFLPSDEDFEFGKVYEIRRAGTNAEGQPVYVKLKVNQKNILDSAVINKQIEDSIRWAIKIFINRENPEAASILEKHEEFKNATGYDLTSISGLREYLGLFIKEVNSDESDTIYTIAKKAEQIDDQIGTPFFSTIGSQIHLGIIGQSFGTDTNGKPIPMQTIHKATMVKGNKAAKDSVNSLLDGLLNIPKRFANNKSRRNVSKAGLTTTNKFAFFKEDGSTSLYKGTYNDFIRNTFRVNLVSANVNTEQDPLYTPYIQPTIGLKIRAGQSETSAKSVLEFKKEGKVSKQAEEVIKEKVKEKQELTPEENDMAIVANIDTSEETASVVTEESMSEEEAELLRKIENDLKKMISPEERAKSNDPNLSPTVLTDEALERIKKQVQRIPGLLPHQQDDLIDVIVDHVLEKIGFTEDSKIGMNEVTESVTSFIASKINPIKEAKQRELILLEGMAAKYPNNPRIPTAIQDTKTLINKIDIINNEENIKTLIAEAQIVLGKEMAIKEVANEKEEADANYSKTSLEENAKEQASYQIRRFLRNIKQYDKEGNLVTGFLGFSKSAEIDIVFDTLTSLLADKDPDFDTMMAVLKNQGAYYPWLYTPTPEGASIDDLADIAEKNKHTFVGKLGRADQSIKNQFVNLMTKHAMSMKFVMYSVNENNKFSLRVWDTNSASSIRNIQKDWNLNFIDKLTLVNEAGEYYIDVEQAKLILEQASNLFKDKPFTISISKELGKELVPVVNSKENRAKFLKGQGIEFTSADTALAKSFEKGKVFSTRISTLGANNKLFPKLYIIESLGNGKYSLKPNVQQTYKAEDLQNFLANVGITVHLETIQDLMKNGMSVKVAGKKKGKFVKIDQMFHVGAETEGVFGLLAYKLRQAILKHEQGEQTTFGVGNDMDLNDSILRKLAAKESKFGSTRPITSWRDNQKTIYGFTPSKFVTDRVNELKRFIEDPEGNADAINQTLEELKKVGFSKESFLIKLLEEEPGFLDKFQASHLGITALKEINKNVYRDNDITHLSDDDHELTKKGAFEDMTQGELKPYIIKVNGIEKSIPMRIASMFGLTMSDKTGMFLFQTGVFDFRKQFFNISGAEITSLRNEPLELMYQQIVLPELNRMFEYSKNKGNYNHYSYNGSLFYLMTGLNNVEVTEGVSIYQHIENNPEMTLKELESTVKESILKEIQDTVTELVTEKKKVWTEAGFVTKAIPEGKTEEVTVLKYFDSKYLDSLQTSNADLQLDLAAHGYVMNYLIHNANMFALFAGDPAQYFKSSESGNTLSDIESTFANVNKRMALLNAPGNKLADASTNQYIQLFLKDNEHMAYDYDRLVKLLGEQGAKAYLETTETDAQEYTTWQEHLYVLEKMGKTPDIIMDIKPEDIEEARKIFSSEKYTLDNLTDVQKALIKKVMQPIKPVYTCSNYDESMNVMRTVYIKSSSFPLIPQLTRGLELDNLRILMEKIQEKEKTNVRAVYHSGVKVGSVKNEMNVFGEQGKMQYIDAAGIQSLRDVDTDMVVAKHGLKLQRNNFRIQQDVPYKAGKRTEDVTTMGTQMSKIILGGKVVRLNDFEYKGNFSDKGFSVSTEKQDGKSLYNSYFQLHDMLILEKKKELYDELGLNENGLPKNLEYSAKVLQRILKDEAINRNYSKQDIDAIELNKNNEFKIPIWLLSNSDRVESLLMSIVEKRLAKMKFPGNSYVVGSEAGFRLNNEASLTEEETGGIIWVNEEARTGLRGNQVLVPSRFRNAEGKLINLVEDGYVIEKEENGRKYYTLDKSKVSPELLGLTNFRIPTSGHNSLSFDEIAGFLPETVGDLMIVSRNKTIQKGLDFDVDKENSYQFWHTVDENGKIVSVSQKYSLSTLDSKVAELLETNKEHFDTLKDLEIQSEKDFLMGEINANKAIISELRAAKTKLIHNEIIKIYNAVLKHPAMQSEISKVLSIESAVSESDYITSILKKDQGRYMPLSDEYQKKQMALGSSGKLGIGAYSLDVVGHSVFTQSYAMGNPLSVNLFAQNQDEEKVQYGISFGGLTSSMNLGDINTIDGKRTIADVLSERQNIATDNVKAEVMGKANLNSYTLDVDKALIMLGFDFGEDGHSIPFLFLSQPIIKDYVAEMQKIESNIAEYVSDKKSYVIQKLIQKYGGESLFTPNVESLNEFGEQCTNEAMTHQIKGQYDNYFQQAILDRFITLDRVGRNIRYIQTTINVDSKGLGVSFFDVIDKIEKVESLFEDMTVISNAGTLIGDYAIASADNPVSELLAAGYVPLNKYYVKPTTVVGAFAVRALSSANQLWSRHYPYQSRTINQVFDEIHSALNDTEDADLIDGAKLNSEAKQKIFKDIKKFIYSTGDFGIFSEDVQAERQRLFFDVVEGRQVKSTSLATYTRALLNHPSMPDSIKKNKFLRSLEYVPQKNGTISMIRFNNAAMESFDEDAIYRSLVDLLTSDIALPTFNGKEYKAYNLITDLISYAYLEGGIQEASQFIKFIPVSYLQEMPFASQLRKLHNFLTKDHKKDFQENDFFGLDFDRVKDPEKFRHNLSIAALQYIQHNPHKVKKIEDLGMLQNQVFAKGENIDTLMEFSINDTKPLTFLTIYNENIKTGKKFQLYKYDPATKTYKRIPVYGTFGMSEYNQNAKQRVLHPSLINKSIAFQALEVATEQQEQAPTDTPLQGVSSLFTKETTLTPALLDKIIAKLEENVDSAYFAELLKQFKSAEFDVKIKIDTIKDSSGNEIAGRGAYDHKTNTIILDVNFAKEATAKELNEVFVHELIHGLTVNSLKPFLGDGKIQSLNAVNFANAPAHVVRIVNLYRDARKYIIENNPGVLESINPKLVLSPEQRKVYGGYDVYEFIAEIMSNKDFMNMMNVKSEGKVKTFTQRFKDFIISALKHLNINIDKGTIAEQAIITSLEIINQNAIVSDQTQKREIMESLRAGDKVTINYTSQSSSDENVTRTITIHDINDNYIIGFDNYREEVREFRKDRVHSIVDVQRGAADLPFINIWYGTGEHTQLSNIAYRPFTFNGVEYISVEHAYQTLKSGEFDSDVYEAFRNEYEVLAKTIADEMTIEDRKKAHERLLEKSAEAEDVYTLANQAIIDRFLNRAGLSPDGFRLTYSFPTSVFVQKYDSTTEKWISNNEVLNEYKSLMSEEALQQVTNVFKTQVKALLVENVKKLEEESDIIDRNINHLFEGFNGIQYKKENAINNIYVQDGQYVTEYNGEPVIAKTEEALEEKISLKAFREAKNFRLPTIKGKKGEYTHNEAHVNLMESLIAESMKQNPDAIKALLDTGGSILTHVQASDNWRNDLPAILMKLRGYFKDSPDNTRSSVPSQVVEIDQYKITVNTLGEMFFKNGQRVNDQTIINKVKLKLNTNPDRIVFYNKYEYYVFEDGTIVNFQTGKTVYEGKTADRANILGLLDKQLNPMSEQTEDLVQEQQDKSLLEKVDAAVKKINNAVENAIFKLRTTMIAYTSGQKEALEKISRFIDIETDGTDYFLLAGYAGTGKTTILENIVKYAQRTGKSAVILAPTNKAASIAKGKLQASNTEVEATTIHRMMYGEPDENGNWIPKELKPNTVYIVDESSMMSQSVLDDMMMLAEEVQSKVIFVGDSFQLEPVESDPKLFLWNNKEFNKANMHELTEVKRQNAGTILTLATALRTLKGAAFMPNKSQDDFRIVDNVKFNSLIAESFAKGEDAVVITSTNEKRVNYNHLVRKSLFGEKASNMINQGDKMIITASNERLTNGEMIVVDDFEVNADFDLTFMIKDRPVKIPFQLMSVYITNPVNGRREVHNILFSPDLPVASFPTQELLKKVMDEGKLHYVEDYTIRTKSGEVKIKDLLTATYGYSVTAHKSQGSEWDKVFLDATWLHNGWNKARWFYTAITRARKEIVTMPSKHVSAKSIEAINEIAASSQVVDAPLTQEQIDNSDTVFNLSPAESVLDFVSDQEIAEISSTFVDAHNKPIC